MLIVLLAQGLTTGFCGCLTTFSAWNSDAASMSAQGKVLRCITCLIVGFSTSWSCLRFGVGAGSWFAEKRAAPRAVTVSEMVRIDTSVVESLSAKRVDSKENDATNTSSSSSIFLFDSYETQFVALMIVVMTVGWTAGFAHATATSAHDRAHVFLGLLFAPCFALVRFGLGVRNHARFPAYTLLANIAGTALTSIASGLLDSSTVDPSADTSMFLKAIQFGAAGCLSTVSTFVNEVRTIKDFKDATVYAATSLGLAQVVSTVVHLAFRADSGDL